MYYCKENETYIYFYKYKSDKCGMHLDLSTKVNYLKNHSAAGQGCGMHIL